MNQCTLCNPSNVHKRDQAYQLLASGCTLASVAERLNISYMVVSRCWSEHDHDPVRNITRRLVKAKKRLARAETAHKRMKEPTVQARLELDAALKSVNDLETLARQHAPAEDKTVSGETVLTLEGLDRILATGIPPGTDRRASEKLHHVIDFLLGNRKEEFCLAMLHYLQQNGVEVRIAKSWDEFYGWGSTIQLRETLPAREYTHA